MPFPCMEPPRCFIICIDRDLRLKSSPDGKISVSYNKKRSEQWFVLPLKSDESVLLQSAENGHFLSLDYSRKLVSSTDKNSPNCKWHFEPSSDGFFIVSTLYGDKLGCDENSDFVVADQSGGWLSWMRSSLVQPSSWKFEFLSGELCFMSMPDFDKRLRCDIFGTLSAGNKWEGWEVWRFIEVGGGDVVINSWTHEKKYLCSNHKGRVYTSEDRIGSWEKWRVKKAPSADYVVVTSVSNGRMLGFDGKKFFTTNNEKKCSIKWQLEAAHKHKYFISFCSNKKQIGCTSKGLFLSGPQNKESQEWLFESAGDGLVAFFSCTHGKYLSSNKIGNVGLADFKDDNAYWQVRESEHGGVALVSMANGRKLACDDKGLLCTIYFDDSCDDTWHIEPCMPKTISGKQIWTIAAGGAVGLATMVAAPFAVTGIIGAMGFTAEGIAAGSMAAGMMSAEAIAAGGGVVAGGTVATLQSIGAAGLGLAGTSAALGGGALVGGSIAGATAAAALESEGRNSFDGRQHSSSSTRPFCDWRSWA